MDSEGMLVDPEVAIKEDALSSIYDEETFSDTSSEAPFDSFDSSESQSTCEDQSMDKEDVKARLAIKNREIQLAKYVLKQFPSWLMESEELIPEVGDWLEDIRAIFEHGDLPRVVLGFMGQSGCGKSSVINALLDEEALLPCNCMEACTAVAVEISWNASTNTSEAYKCVVEFITIEEWKEELESLIADVLSLDLGSRSNPLASDESVAAAKMKTVYPNLDLSSLIPDSAAKLLNDDAVSGILGQQKVIKAAAGAGRYFASQIKSFIDSSNSSANSDHRARNPKKVPYWPLIKVVKLYIKSEVLSTGLVIVDLPGSGDSNAARAIVAEQYMQSVEAICIVADIKRALTNSVARNLFGRGDTLKRRLLRNGLLDEERTFFVLTCTDIINNRQVIETQGLNDVVEITELLQSQQTKTSRKDNVSQRLNYLTERQKQRLPILASLANREKSLQSTPKGPVHEARKRKRGDLEVEGVEDVEVSVEPSADSNLARIRIDLEKRKKAHGICNNQIKDLTIEQKCLEDELIKLEHQLTTICIKKRNSHVIHRMGIDFSLGLSELERDLNDEGDEAAFSVPKSQASVCRNGAQTFCVCAKAFQKLHGRFNEDQMPSGFESLDDTSLPQLKAHCLEFTLNAMERLADRFLEDLTRLRTRMREWADNTTPDRQVTTKQKHELKGKFKEHREARLNNVLEFIKNIDDRISKNIDALRSRSMGVAVKMAERKAEEIFEHWTEQAPSGQTWRAICRKEGVHKSRTRGEGPILHNWNEDLADGLIRVLDRNLNDLFNTALPEVRDGYVASMESIMSTFPTALAASCLLINKHIANPLQNLLHTLLRHEAEMYRTILNRFMLSITMGRNVGQKVPSKIRQAMKTGYTEAASFTGAGSAHAAREKIEEHLEKVKCNMYKGASKDVAEAVGNVFFMLKGNLRNDMDTRFSKIENAFEKMLITATRTPRPETGLWKIKLQAEVLERLAAFDGVLGEFRSANDEAIDDDDSHRKSDASGDNVVGDNSRSQDERIFGETFYDADDAVEDIKFSDEED